MKILIGCEESQTVTKAFRALGHEAYSCDIQECSGGHPEWHYQADIFEVINIGWDMAIFHPPCTYLSNVGNRWYNEKRYKEKAIERKKLRHEATSFFMSLWNCDIPKICIENPTGWINHILPVSQVIQPYYFGDSCTKRTCLWLKNLPPLLHSNNDTLFYKKTWVYKGKMAIGGSEQLFGIHMLRKTQEERRKIRSKTFEGIAQAMAEQWG